MPTLSPPPYQDPQDSFSWNAWYNQINNLLEGISLSINNIDDVDIESAADGDILVYDGTAAKWRPATEANTLDIAFGANDLIMGDGPFWRDPNGNEYAQWLASGGATHFLRMRNGSSASGFVMSMESSAHVEGGHFFIANTGNSVDDDALVCISGIGREEIMEFESVSSAINEIHVANAAASGKPSMTTTGGDTNIGMSIQPKGSGVIKAANQNMGPTTAVTAATHTHAIDERYLLCDTTSNAITVDLLAAATAGDGYRIDIKIVNATNAVTIDGNGSETIDGATTQVLSVLYSNLSLVCDGSNWHIL
jgi:hypothetical protein